MGTTGSRWRRPTMASVIAFAIVAFSGLFLRITGVRDRLILARYGFPGDPHDPVLKTRLDLFVVSIVDMHEWTFPVGMQRTRTVIVIGGFPIYSLTHAILLAGRQHRLRHLKEECDCACAVHCP